MLTSRSSMLSATQCIICELCNILRAKMADPCLNLLLPAFTVGITKKILIYWLEPSARFCLPQNSVKILFLCSWGLPNFFLCFVWYMLYTKMPGSAFHLLALLVSTKCILFHSILKCQNLWIYMSESSASRNFPSPETVSIFKLFLQPLSHPVRSLCSDYVGMLTSIC